MLIVLSKAQVLSIEQFFLKGFLHCVICAHSRASNKQTGDIHILQYQETLGHWTSRGSSHHA